MTVTIPKKVSDRLVQQVGTFQKVLRGAKDRDVNESDTVTIVTDMLASVFGFDKYTEVTSEQAIKGTFCDLAVKLDGKIELLIEVKAIGLTLKENHLQQAIGYGANEGIDWVVLTNGINWEIYKIRFTKPIDCQQVCSFDFLEMNAKRKQDQSELFLLCKEGLGKDALDRLHKRVQIVNRFVIGATVLSEPVLNVIRRQLRKISSGVKVSPEQIEEILTNEVLKRDIVEGESSKHAKSLVKKAQGKKPKQSTKSKPKETPEPQSPETPPD